MAYPPKAPSKPTTTVTKPYHIMHDLILLTAGFLAAFIGTMSGGGFGLISLFVLLSMGMPINQAIATNKLGDIGFFLPAVRNLVNAHQIKKGALPPIIIVNLLGVVVGTLAIVKLDIDILRKLIAVILLIVVVAGLSGHKYALKERPARWYWPFAYFATAISAGTIGAGTGILGTFALIYFRGFTALQAMAHGFYARSISSVLSVIILLFTDLINYRYGFLLLIGNLVGSHLGSKIAIKKGNAFVRIMMIILASVVILQLILKG